MGFLSFLKGATGRALERGEEFSRSLRDRFEKRAQKQKEEERKERKQTLSFSVPVTKRAIKEQIHKTAGKIREPKSFAGKGVKKSMDLLDTLQTGSAKTLGENIGDVAILHGDKMPSTFLKGALTQRAREKNEAIQLLREQKKNEEEELTKKIQELRSQGKREDAESLEAQLRDSHAKIDAMIGEIAPITKKTKLQILAETGEFAIDFGALVLSALGGAPAGASAKAALQALKVGKLPAKSAPLILKSAAKIGGEGATMGVIQSAKEGENDPLNLALGGGSGAAMGLLFFGGVKGVGKGVSKAKKAVAKKTTEFFENTVGAPKDLVSNLQQNVSRNVTKRFSGVDDVLKHSDTFEEFAHNFESHQQRVLGEVNVLQEKGARTADEARQLTKVFQQEDEIQDMLKVGEDGMAEFFEKRKPKADVLTKTVEGIDDTQEVMLRQVLKVSEDRPITDLEKKSLQRMTGIAEEKLKDMNTVSARKLVSERFRLDKLPDVQEEVAQIILDNGGFEKQRRGKITHKQTEEMAREIVPQIKLKPGTALNAEEGIAIAQTLVNTKNKITSLVKQVDDAMKNPSPEKNIDFLKLRLEKAINEQTVITSSLLGVKSEMGRGLSATRIINRALETGDTGLIKELVRKGTITDKQMNQVATALAMFGNDEIAKFRYLRNLSKPTFDEWHGWFVYGNMLSAISTQTKNIAGAFGNMLFRTMSKSTAAAIDLSLTSVSKMSGGKREREVFLSEIPKEFIGATQGVKEGLHKAMYMIRHGFSMDNLANREFGRAEPIREVTSIFGKDIRVGKGVEIAANLVGRSMEGGDIFTRSLAASGELNASAWALAKKEGLKGEKLMARHGELVANPPQNLLEKVNKSAAEAVFREESGEFLRYMTKIRNLGKVQIITKKGKRVTIVPSVGRMLIPFVETPGKIFKQGIDATPLGFLRSFKREAGRDRTLAMGRAALGSFLMAPLAYAAFEGNISGSGPSDQEVRDQLFRKGWKPNSIRIGDTWYPYTNFAPMHTPLALIGNFHDQVTYEDNELGFEDVGVIVARMGNTLFDASYLQGVDNLLKAFDDPERYGGRVIEGIVRMHVPAASILGSVARSVDDIFRRPESIKEGLMTQLPGLSKKVAPRIDGKGQPARRPGFKPFGFNVTEFLSPIKPSKVISDPVVEELERINYAVPKANRSAMKGYKMKGETFAKYSIMRNQTIDKVAQEIIRNPEWESLSSLDKQDVMSEVVREVNSAVRPFIIESAARDLGKRMKKVDPSERKQFLLDEMDDGLPEDVVLRFLELAQ